MRATTAAVMAQARHVRIVPAAVEALARAWAAEGVSAPGWYPKHHFFDGTHRSANWLLALDAVNFSFWSEDPAERWTVDYQGERLDGYWALAACMKRALEIGFRLWDAKVLANLHPGDVTTIFSGANMIPCYQDRLNGLREVGQVLLDKYRGQFIHAIAAAGHSAPGLVALLARDFPSFNDVARYQGAEVRFYKRAQLLVSDLWGAFGGKGWGAFSNMDSLTAFADYKLPQLLREHEALQYSPELASVDARRLMAPGCPEEVEIRAATVQAVELLRDALTAHGVSLSAFQVDWLLWQRSQGVQMQHPYHLCRTIYY